MIIIIFFQLPQIYVNTTFQKNYYSITGVALHI